MASWTPTSEVRTIIQDLEATFKAGKTLPVEWRKEQLKQLWRMIDIAHALKRIDSWVKPEVYDAEPPYNYWQPTMHKQSKVTALIISPWNFPICLSIAAFVGTVAAGCTVILKPSEVSPHSSAVLAELIPKYLDKGCFKILTGDKELVTKLLDCPFGHILCIGRAEIGKIILTAAAKNLTPVTLELGGKNPVIVSEKANIALAAKRIAWSKHYGAGQLCITPDYALEFETNYGPETHKNMAHIINKPHYERVMSLLNSTKGTIHGCSRDPSTFFIELTLITDLIPDDILFKSEVFSPILPNPPRPLLQNPPGHALAYQPNLPSTPLATYIMSEDQAESPFAISHTSSGGVSTNDLFSQAVVPGMPFGGVGTSGNGKFHGKAGFEIFTNLKGVCNMPTGAEYEAMTEFRYATGDLERKYLMLKSMEEKAI